MVEQNEYETELQAYIAAIRQGNGDWSAFKDFVERNIKAICLHANLRWLASICDTYADHGEPIERRNAMLISVLVKMEKIAQTYVHWRLEYPGELGVPTEDKHRKIRLPEGLSSFNLDIGDAPNTMFGRMADMLSDTPILCAILDAVKARLAKSDSILVTSTAVTVMSSRMTIAGSCETNIGSIVTAAESRGTAGSIGNRTRPKLNVLCGSKADVAASLFQPPVARVRLVANYPAHQTV